MSQPRILYRFVEGSSVYTVTSSNKPETYNSEVYQPITIGLHSNIESKQAANRGSLDVGIEIGNVTARRWMTSNLRHRVGVTIFKKDGTTVQTIWSGQLIKAKPNDTTIVFTFEDGSGDARQSGVDLVVQSTCPYTHYGYGCFLNKADFATVGTIASITATTVSVSAASDHPDGYFTGGMIADSLGNLIFITAHSGSNLTIIRPMTAAIGDAVTIYPGCDRLPQTCKDKFNNLDRFGGFQWIPHVNYFNGVPIA